MYLLRKGVNALWLIFGMFAICILAYWVGMQWPWLLVQTQS